MNAIAELKTDALSTHLAYLGNRDPGDVPRELVAHGCESGKSWRHEQPIPRSIRLVGRAKPKVLGSTFTTVVVKVRTALYTRSQNIAQKGRKKSTDN